MSGLYFKSITIRLCLTITKVSPQVPLQTSIPHIMRRRSDVSFRSHISPEVADHSETLL